MMEIILIYGGISVEHAASISMFEYATREMSKTNACQHRIQSVIYISQQGDVFSYSFSNVGELATLCPHDTRKYKRISLPSLVEMLCQPNTYVYSLMQGSQGEDGETQGLMEFLAIQSNFGTVYSACTSMDKWTQALIAKEVCGDLLGVIPTKALHASSKKGDIGSALSFFEGKCVILKPNSQGGSVLAEIFENPMHDRVFVHLRKIWKIDDIALIQERIFGTEVSCGCIFRNGNWEALPIFTLHPASGFMGVNEKFGRSGYHRKVLSTKSLWADAIKESSLRLAQHGGFHTVCRFDYIVDNNGTVFLLECNSKPGLLQTSLFIVMLEEASISYAELFDIFISNEISRQDRNTNLRRARANFFAPGLHNLNSTS